jgi:hypothetical protein
MSSSQSLPSAGSMGGNAAPTNASSNSNANANIGENIVRIGYHDKPSVAQMKTILQQQLQVLANFVYDGDKCNDYTKELSNRIRYQLKDLGKDRYKYVVQVMIGERRDQGIRFVRGNF